ncbi:MAG: 16S rRNA (cytidine(1402)-2'-O)-methyltransferase [Bacteroidales bacterium]|nr:16S rRNA (cytidine(1402)-2'-O)-methyltransferase [Bacteroidales bacterium]
MAKLYIVPTPIGNLKDITLRALEVLKSADLILAEDTRKTGILLKHFEIRAKLKSHHKFNEHKDIDKISNDIAEGLNAALVSDAGTPGISDPGFLLVRKCIEIGIEVETLPGATAFVPALVNSGLPCDRFIFEGFLPVKKGRATKIANLSEENRSIVLYESPHRLLKTLKQFSEVAGEERRASVSREISKIHEETVRGTLKELVSHFEENMPRGEIVIIIEGK